MILIMAKQSASELCSIVVEQDKTKQILMSAE